MEKDYKAQENAKQPINNEHCINFAIYEQLATQPIQILSAKSRLNNLILMKNVNIKWCLSIQNFFIHKFKSAQLSTIRAAANLRAVKSYFQLLKTLDCSCIYHVQTHVLKNLSMLGDILRGQFFLRASRKWMDKYVGFKLLS